MYQKKRTNPLVVMYYLYHNEVSILICQNINMICFLEQQL